MTALRKRFLEDLRLHGFAPSTQGVYVPAVKQLARHYHRPPDQSTEDLRPWTCSQGGPTRELSVATRPPPPKDRASTAFPGSSAGDLAPA